MNYTVRAGDTLNSIAARFGVPVQELIRVNQITPPYYIYVGQTLYIPITAPGPGPGPRPGPRPGPGPGPGPGPQPGNVNRRLDRLETRVDRLETRMDRLERRVDRLEGRS